MIVKSSKVEQLREQLTHSIAKMSEGERFLSVRNIMKQYSVSQTTVDQTLNLLESNGLLQRERGKGIFIRNTRVDRLNICFLTPQWQSMSLMEMQEDLQTVANEQGHHLQSRTFAIGDDIWNHLPTQEFDGLIYLNGSDYICPECLSKMLNAPIPVVFRGAALKEVRVSSVTSNSMAGGAKAASHLIAQGHRNLALVLSNPITSSAMRDRMDGFLLMAQMNDVPVTVLDCKIKSGEQSTEKTYDYVHRYLNENKIEFTAMLAIEDETALAVIHALQDHGMNVPEDMSVMGYGGYRRSAFFNPPLTSIKTDTHTESIETFNAIAQMLVDRSQVIKKLVMPSVIQRQSVRKLV